MKSKKGSRMKEEKSAEVSKLKKRIRSLEKKNRELISKLNTLDSVLEKNLKFLKGSTADVTLEDLMEAAKSDTTLKEVKDKNCCPKCEATEGFTRVPTKVGVIESCLCGYRGVL